MFALRDLFCNSVSSCMDLLVPTHSIAALRINQYKQLPLDHVLYIVVCQVGVMISRICSPLVVVAVRAPFQHHMRSTRTTLTRCTLVLSNIQYTLPVEPSRRLCRTLRTGARVASYMSGQSIGSTRPTAKRGLLFRTFEYGYCFRAGSCMALSSVCCQ